MGQLHILSTATFGSLQLQRLRAELKREIAADTDLGSRVPHIQAIGSTLTGICDKLEERLEALVKEGCRPEIEQARNTCRRLIGDTRRLAELAQCYPADQHLG